MSTCDLCTEDAEPESALCRAHADDALRDHAEQMAYDAHRESLP